VFMAAGGAKSGVLPAVRNQAVGRPEHTPSVEMHMICDSREDVTQQAPGCVLR